MKSWPHETKCSRLLATALTEHVGGTGVRFEPSRIPGSHFAPESSWPDVWWLVDRTTVFVELKKDANKVSPAQRVKLTRPSQGRILRARIAAALGCSVL